MLARSWDNLNAPVIPYHGKLLLLANFFFFHIIDDSCLVDLGVVDIAYGFETLIFFMSDLFSVRLTSTHISLGFLRLRCSLSPTIFLLNGGDIALQIDDFFLSTFVILRSLLNFVHILLFDRWRGQQMVNRHKDEHNELADGLIALVKEAHSTLIEVLHESVS